MVEASGASEWTLGATRVSPPQARRLAPELKPPSSVFTHLGSGFAVFTTSSLRSDLFFLLIKCNTSLKQPVLHLLVLGNCRAQLL